MKVSVSYLKSPYSKEKTINLIENTSADYLHVDLMDGKFVERKNFEVNEIKELLKNVKKPLDIHFMTEDVENYIKEFSDLKASFMTFQIEANTNISNTINLIKSYGIKVGLAIKPDTPLESLTPFLKDIDLVLIMSVEPGMGGQPFLKETINRLRKIKEIQHDYSFLISVDGGINENTIKDVKDYIDIAVSGSFICESNDYEEQIVKLKNETK